MIRAHDIYHSRKCFILRVLIKEKVFKKKYMIYYIFIKSLYIYQHGTELTRPSSESSEGQTTYFLVCLNENNVILIRFLFFSSKDITKCKFSRPNEKYAKCKD